MTETFTKNHIITKEEKVCQLFVSSAFCPAAFIHFYFTHFLSYLAEPSASWEHCCVKKYENLGLTHRMQTPPPSLRVAKAGKNHLNEKITPLLPPE